MTPISVAKTGGSSTATINADGSVTFSSCVTLSLNGVFTSSYDNYMMTLRVVDAAANDAIFVRLRASGTDASGANYNYQYLLASGTSITGFRFTADTQGFRILNADTVHGGDTVYFFGPYLAQPTAVRNTSVIGLSNGTLLDFASTHSLSTAYDGFSLLPLSASAAITGLLTVFGFNQ
jgi:hypothetical protein